MTTMETSTVTEQQTISGERADILDMLAKHRSSCASPCRA